MLAVTIALVCLVFSIVDLYPMGGGLYDGDTFSAGIDYLHSYPYIYNNQTFDISFGYTPAKGTMLLYCSYAIIDSSHKTIDSSILMHYPFFSEYLFSKRLTNLANGNYTITLYAQYINGTMHLPLNETFTVDTTYIEPKLTLISPQNQTYTKNTVDIIYNVNSKVIWSYYNLDNQNRVDWTPFSGNTTINGLSEGLHTLAICIRTVANEHSYNISETQTIYFRINPYESK